MLEEFLRLFPKFATTQVEETAIAFRLEMAQTYCGDAWGTKRQYGIFLLTAHWLEMEWLQTAVTAGTATAIAAGNGGVNPSSSESDFNLTTYGRQYLELKKTVFTCGISN